MLNVPDGMYAVHVRQVEMECICTILLLQSNGMSLATRMKKPWIPMNQLLSVMTRLRLFQKYLSGNSIVAFIVTSRL